jgi:hypothetical protein
MAPRTRRIACTEGLVHFDAGVNENQIQDFLKTNSIERVKGSPQYLTTDDKTVAIQVPPAETYIVPDDMYVWIRTDLAK